VISAFDQIVIEVPDLEPALADYQQLLGAFEREGNTATLALGNVVIVLRENHQLTAAKIIGLSLFDEALNAGERRSLAEPNRGLAIEQVGTMLPRSTSPTATGIAAVDHVVLMTGDADECIRLFGEHGLGIRLALDQMVPEWGGRMLFFRAGKMTLEVIHNLDKPPAKDAFWGLTFLCDSLEHSLAMLDGSSVLHSDIRTGRKPGTRVASIKSHQLGLPTLLIEVAAGQ
jgi:hypothetical protein